jgi:hypothetical protein
MAKCLGREIGEVVYLDRPINVTKLAGIFGAQPFEVLAQLMKQGALASLVQELPDETVSELAKRYGVVVLPTPGSTFGLS